MSVHYRHTQNDSHRKHHKISNINVFIDIFDNLISIKIYELASSLSKIISMI